MPNRPSAMTNSTVDDRLIDVKAVAAKLGCDPRTVYRLAEAGKMPTGVKLGALRRWHERTINEWIANGCKAVEAALAGGGE